MDGGVLQRIYKRKPVDSNLSVIWSLTVNKEVGS